MNWSSLPWPFKKRGNGSDSTVDRSSPSDVSPKKNEKEEVEDEEFGITDSLLDFVKTFTIDTFKSCHLGQGTLFC